MDRARASVWQVAQQKVQQTLRSFSGVDDEPLAELITDFTDSVRRARSITDAIDVALAGLHERLGASSILLLEKGADGDYHSRTCSLPARGVLMNRLRRYQHPLPFSQEHVDTWRRWAQDLGPEHVAEVEMLASIGIRMAVPLRTKTGIVGVLLLGAPKAREQYTTAQRQFLNNLGELFAFMLENARLAERAVEQDRLRRDLAMAAEVQKRLLPPQPPRSTAATFAAFTLPARTVGGDYYDFLDLGDERVGIAVADVSGKGIAAALLMSVVQASLRVIATTQDLAVSQLAEKMNGFLYQSTEANRYVTFFYAQIDEQGRRLRYVNAGHNPPWLIRSSEGVTTVVELCTGGTALGLFPDVRYEEGHLDLLPGDIVVAFTDGVIEAHNPAGHEFGEERLQAVLRGMTGVPAHQISTALADTMREWTGNAEQYDDLTFVVVSLDTSSAQNDVQTTRGAAETVG